MYAVHAPVLALLVCACLQLLSPAGVAVWLSLPLQLYAPQGGRSAYEVTPMYSVKCVPVSVADAASE